MQIWVRIFVFLDLDKVFLCGEEGDLFFLDGIHFFLEGACIF